MAVFGKKKKKVFAKTALQEKIAAEKHIKNMEAALTPGGLMPVNTVGAAMDATASEIAVRMDQHTRQTLSMPGSARMEGLREQHPEYFYSYVQMSQMEREFNDRLSITEPGTNQAPKPTREVAVLDIDAELAALDTEVADKAESLLGYSQLSNVVRKEKAKGEVLRVFKKLNIKPFVEAQVDEYKRRAKQNAERAHNALSRPMSGMYYSSAMWAEYGIEAFNKPIPTFALQTAIKIKEEIAGATFTIDELTVQHIPVDPFLIMNYHGLKFYLEVWDEPTFTGKREA